MLINLSLVLLFSINVFMRLSTGPHAVAPVVLSVVGVVGLAISGWLGGELVYVRGVGVGDQRLSEPPVKRRELKMNESPNELSRGWNAIQNCELKE